MNYFFIFNSIIKKIEKYSTVFGYVMKNKLENYLLIYIF